VATASVLTVRLSLFICRLLLRFFTAYPRLTPNLKGAAITTICIDCRYIGPQPSGIGELVQGLIDHLPALAPDIHFRLLRNPLHRAPLSGADNVSEHDVRAGANSPSSMWFLPRLAPLDGCDLFHSPSNILPARIPCKSVTTIHDIMWLTNPDWCDGTPFPPIKRRFFAYGIERALKHSSHIACVSEATRSAIAEYAPQVKPRLSVTFSGVAERFSPAARDESVLARLGIENGKRFILVVGQFAPYKNHEGALKAFAEALGDDEETVLVLVQRRGPSAEPLEALARKLGIASQLRFTGPIDEADLIQLYSQAEILLHPSLCEGFGNPVAEAMACGCPVITSNISAMPEVTGTAARLIDPQVTQTIANALTELWHDKAERASLRGAGLARAKQLRWVDFAKANLAIYRAQLDLK